MIIDLRISAASVGELVTMFWGILIVNADARAVGAFPEVDDLSDRPDWMVRNRLEAKTGVVDMTDQWDWVRLDLRA